MPDMYVSKNGEVFIKPEGWIPEWKQQGGVAKKSIIDKLCKEVIRYPDGHCEYKDDVESRELECMIKASDEVRLRNMETGELTREAFENILKRSWKEYKGKKITESEIWDRAAKLVEESERVAKEKNILENESYYFRKNWIRDYKPK